MPDDVPEVFERIPPWLPDAVAWTCMLEPGESGRFDCDQNGAVWARLVKPIKEAEIVKLVEPGKD